MRRIAFAILALVAITGCSSTTTVTVPPATPPSSPSGPVGGVATPSGSVSLPCNPQSSSCWIPAVNETYMAYSPPHNYTDARVLAAAASCQVLSGSQYVPATPTATQAECGFGGATMGDGLSEAWIFSSPTAEAAEAQKMAQDAYNSDTADYAVLGKGWLVGTITTVDDTQALRVHDATGGVVVCFPGRDAEGGSC